MRIEIICIVLGVLLGELAASMHYAKPTCQVVIVVDENSKLVGSATNGSACLDPSVVKAKAQKGI